MTERCPPEGDCATTSRFLASSVGLACLPSLILISYHISLDTVNERDIIIEVTMPQEQAYHLIC